MVLYKFCFNNEICEKLLFLKRALKVKCRGEDTRTTKMIFNKKNYLWKNCGGVTTKNMAALTQINIGSGAKDSITNKIDSLNNSYARLFCKEVGTEGHKIEPSN